MLISFSIKNWMSFRDKTCFTMIASQEDQHKERLSTVSKYKIKALPIATIYGGNASGKTNFFKALSFAQRLIIKGTQPDAPIPAEPFCLDTNALKQPSHFSFELLIDEIIYEFSFAVTNKHIVEEKLVQAKSTVEKVLYDRQGADPNFDTSLQKDLALKYAFQGTRDNQLFLTNTISQKITKFQKIYDWFKTTLVLVAPDSRFNSFEQFLNEEHTLYKSMNEALSSLHTGITRLGEEEIPLESLQLSESFKLKLQEEIKEGKTAKIMARENRFVIWRKNNKLVAKKLVTYHQNSEGKEVKFEIDKESDGTKRLIDLLPAFLALSTTRSDRVYVIDEIDRSLHTLLTRRLIEEYLENCSAKTRTQLLMTTHDLLLMDQNILRRDEMWVTERDTTGASTLFCFSRYKDVRSDKDIRKSYLQGRLGGVPHLLLDDLFPRRSSAETARE